MKVLPVAWQVAHAAPLTAPWFIGVPAKLVKTEEEWQLSQAVVPTGMWVAGRTLSVGGAMFAKLAVAP